ncbi:unnamed protein product [Parnassius mnemosyne]|uniref:Zinc finger PHD-type domain-containing protein n=1 Tax=Parnassius mnemosyne TaxID=213953 RepID=A0AAV1KIA6_9NEOP
MANKCGACGRFASTIDSTKCSSCTHLFHRKCASIPIDGRISNKWQCSGCKAKNVCASGVNTIATPSSCSSGGTDTEFGDAQLGSDDRGRCETNVDLANELKLIREQLTTIAREMVSFRQEITNINSNVSEISNRVSDVEKRIACLEEQATNLTSQPGGSKVEDSVAELKCRLNERDQELLLNDLEISGVIEQKGENPLHLVTMLAAKIGTELDERDVVSARRIGMRREEIPGSGDKRRPRPDPKILTEGTAQGSVLGPLHFLSYVNESETQFLLPIRRRYVSSRIG